jgi:hypothetical protein
MPPHKNKSGPRAKAHRECVELRSYLNCARHIVEGRKLTLQGLDWLSAQVEAILDAAEIEDEERKAS